MHAEADVMMSSRWAKFGLDLSSFLGVSFTQKRSHTHIVSTSGQIVSFNFGLFQTHFSPLWPQNGRSDRKDNTAD